MKTRFYTAHEYGMGSVVQIIHARNADEIYLKYPQLIVFTPNDEWLAAHGSVTFREYDVDDAPDELMKPYTVSGPDDPIKHRRLLDPFVGTFADLGRRRDLSFRKYDRGSQTLDLVFSNKAVIVLTADPENKELRLKAWRLDAASPRKSLVIHDERLPASVAPKDLAMVLDRVWAEVANGAARS